MRSAFSRPLYSFHPYFSIPSATPVSYWDDIPVNQILRENGGGIFNTSDPLTRRAIDDLDELDLLDAEGREIPIYNADGRRIARRIPYILEDEQPLSILQDLSLTHELFTSTLRPSHEGPSEEDIIDLDDDDDRAGTPAGANDSTTEKFYVYPLAFTKKWGQWQAKALMPSLTRLLLPFARSLSNTEAGPVCIEGVKSQCYNNSSHAFRSSSKAHIAQRGIVTGAATGSWHTNVKSHATASHLSRDVEAAFPHDRLATQINNVESSALRFENVITFHFDHMKPEYKRGDKFYKEVIFGFVNLINHPNVSMPIRRACVVLKPKVRVIPLCALRDARCTLLTKHPLPRCILACCSGRRIPTRRYSNRYMSTKSKRGPSKTLHNALNPFTSR